MWLSFADSVAAELPAHFQTSLSGLPFRLPLSSGEPHTSPKKVCSQTPLFFMSLLSLLQERQEKQEKQEFSIFNSLRECISRSRCKACVARESAACSTQSSEWVLRGDFCAEQASKSAVYKRYMRNLRGAARCKKHPQGTLDSEMCLPYLFLPKRLCANSLSGSTLAELTSRLASESIALMK